jgi:hypothetical protein
VWKQIGVFDDPSVASVAYHAEANKLHGAFRRPGV